MNRWLLGFDVRTAKEQYVSRHWGRDARAEYLLHPDIEWPLSIDERVWPSVFSTFRDSTMVSYSAIEIEFEVHCANRLDLERMRTSYDAHRALAPDGVFVGIELLSETTADGQSIPYEQPAGTGCAIWLDPTVPDRLPEGSTLLGYDVADAGWISGLADCGYTKEEIDDLGSVWARRLNSFGLLSTLEDAVTFRQVSDQRVPEHAPFWVYALWRLPFD